MDGAYLRRSTASTATSTRICGVIWIIFLLPAKPAASYPNPVPILWSPRASCRERTPTPLHTPSAPLPVEPTAQETPTAPVESSGCKPATASSTACNPFAAPSWCSAVHAAAPSPPPPPRSAPAVFFFNDSATTEIYTLSLHDPLPISEERASAAQAADGVSGNLVQGAALPLADRKSTRLNSSHPSISYAVFCLKK